MTDSDPVVAVIAEVLRKHYSGARAFDGEHGCCGCADWRLGMGVPFTTHQAEVVAAAVREAGAVTTVEQLDALPQFSIVRDRTGTAWEKEDHGSPETPWWQTGDSRNSPSSRVHLPAQLLWAPGRAVVAEREQ